MTNLTMRDSFILESRGLSSERWQFADRFAKVQNELRQDPYRIGLSDPVLCTRFVQAELPFPTEFWILRGSQSQPLGRISANLSLTYPKTGYLGFFEAYNFESAKILLQAGLEWLKTQGVQTVHGPVNFNTWMPYRFRIDEDDSPLFAFEPVNPPEYPSWFAELGFRVTETYHSHALEGFEGTFRKFEGDYQSALTRGFTFRQAGASGQLESDLKSLHEISSISFKPHFLFEPISFELFRSFYVPMVQEPTSNLTHLICDPDQKVVGYFSTWIEKEHLILKTAALLPEAQGLRLSNALLYEAALRGKENGALYPVTALIRSGSQSEGHCKDQKTLWKHRYALFSKEI